MHISVTNEKVFKWWDYLLYVFLTVLNYAATYYFLGYWFTQADWRRSPIVLSILTFMLLLNLFKYQMRWISLPLMRRPRPMPPRPGWKVGVATTFVPGAESIEMLEETVRALIVMEYPHETWVLDEGDDPAVKELCSRLGAYHFTRKHRPSYQTSTGTFEARTKHGNYNAWLYEVGFKHYDIISAFDPDHIPQPDFLMQVLGYFNDPSIGYVQAPQAYYNQAASFIARGAAEESYEFYSSVQMTIYTMGYPIIIGCHNTHRVTALQAVGGFAPHEADDMLITLHYREQGWRGVYVPTILAKGLTPVDWSSYLLQQRRWARSALDIRFRLYPKAWGTLRFAERIVTFMHGLYYLHGVSAALGVLVLAAMLVTGSTPHLVSLPTGARFAMLLVALQVCEWYRQRFYLDPRREWGVHWRASVLHIAKWPYALLGLYDMLTQHRGPYTITRKVKAKGKQQVLLRPHLFTASVIGLAWLISIALDHTLDPMVHLAAAHAIVSSLGVIATEWITFPDPYDPELAREYVAPICRFSLGERDAAPD